MAKKESPISKKIRSPLKRLTRKLSDSSSDNFLKKQEEPSNFYDDFIKEKLERGIHNDSLRSAAVTVFQETKTSKNPPSENESLDLFGILSNLDSLMMGEERSIQEVFNNRKEYIKGSFFKQDKAPNKLIKDIVQETTPEGRPKLKRTEKVKSFREMLAEEADQKQTQLRNPNKSDPGRGR